MEEDSLQSLAASYAQEVERLGELIDGCKARRGEALRQGESAEAQRQERLLDLHENQRDDLRQLAHWLTHYYDHTKHKQEEKNNADS
ncbi:MAG: hypothetical protein LBC83_07715 [Oscillospiraceae bacterium]|nr:hypothetical protein [Oscillospiraceae bacterium]